MTYQLKALISLAAALVCAASPASGPSASALSDVLPNATMTGFLSVDITAKASLFYAYYKAQQPLHPENTPIVLWLQVCRWLASVRVS